MENYYHNLYYILIINRIIKNILLEITKITQIRRFLFIVAFVSVLSISESSVCAAGSDIRYGFWGWWTDPSDYQPNWNGLTHVAYSSWKVNSDGSLIAPNSITHFTTVRDITHSHGKKFIISIYCDNTRTIDSILANNKEDFANNVLDTVQKYGADGVNLDFEFPQQTNSITRESNKVLFESLMSTLHGVLKNANSNYHISIDTSARIYSVYPNKNLAKYVDSVIIMGYDFAVGNKVTAPNSPYNEIMNSVNDWDNYFDKQQIVLGLPFYGYKYSSTTNKPGSSFKSMEQISMKEAIQAASRDGKLWDSNSNTPWCLYNDGSAWLQIWYDDAQSLKLKYDYAKSQSLGGVAFWSLGSETNDAWSI